MQKLIKLHGHAADWANDRFVNVAEDEPMPDAGGVILSFARYQAEGDALLDTGRPVGVRLEVDQAVEDLAYDLPRLSVVALAFPKFRDGRQYSAARILRERFGFDGEIRAVGDVLREQAAFMVRCGFDAFEPVDGSTPQEWVAAAFRFRHVYQRAADERLPAFVERES
ncbi:MAG TPA: DUF934 domain-containing protein [Caulobacteraceae bacterium]|nr:DUF934 domain-containing protein [Caulobacteraceae bacterium]